MKFYEYGDKQSHTKAARQGFKQVDHLLSAFFENGSVFSTQVFSIVNTEKCLRKYRSFSRNT